MEILCLNCWGGTLHRELLSYLGERRPDILCLQEIVQTPTSPKETLVYRDGDHVLDQRANLFSEIQSALPDYSGTFCPAAQGTLWDGDTEISSQWGLATFSKKTIPIVAQAQDFVHKEFSAFGYGSHPRSRSAHAIRLFNYELEQYVCIAQMHGLRDLGGKGDTPDRKSQVKRFISLLDRISHEGDLKVMCGDFNVQPNSETLEILSQSGFTELVTTRTDRGTRNSHYKKPEKFADYMLISDPTAIKDFDVIFDPEVSDHCPLILKI